MNQHPGFRAVPSPDLRQLVGITALFLRTPGDSLQFLVEKFMAARPVDIGGNRWEKPFQERLEVAFQQGFPG